MKKPKQSQFKIGDLFDIVSNPQLDKANFVFSESAKYPYFTRTENNNGILGYVEYFDDAHKIQGNSLAVGMISMKFHYMWHDFYAGQFTKTLIPKFKGFNETIALYFIAELNKKSSYYQGYLVREFVEKVRNTVISLPIIESFNPDHKYTIDDIDWNYMQEQIAELERERIAQLELYLKVTGLSSYALTDEEFEIVEKACGGINRVLRHENFKIGDLFTILKGKRLTKENQTLGKIPFIGSTETNNGITAYIGQQPIYKENAITVSYNGSVGQAFFQETPFWASDDINVLYAKDRELNESLFGYIGTCLKKSGKAFSYTQKWNLERMKTSDICLPIQLNTDGTPKIDETHTYHPDGYIPDFDYMEKYIRAMQKQVIADVVKYKDEIIANTKKVVSE